MYYMRYIIPYCTVYCTGLESRLYCHIAVVWFD